MNDLKRIIAIGEKAEAIKFKMQRSKEYEVEAYELLEELNSLLSDHNGESMSMEEVLSVVKD